MKTRQIVGNNQQVDVADRNPFMPVVANVAARSATINANTYIAVMGKMGSNIGNNVGIEKGWAWMLTIHV